MAERYSIYFTLPASDPLYVLACRWLGHDIHQGDHDVGDLTDDLPAVLEASRVVVGKAQKYGFHATLKAPFRLAADSSVKKLDNALRQFCASQQAFACAPLELAVMAGFILLRPQQECAGLKRLADQCVEQFDVFREPLSAKEFNKRHPKKLSEHQRSLLNQWGYPFVMDEFRFHMTLTKRIDEQQRNALLAALKEYLQPALGAPFQVDRIYLCHQASAKQKFNVIAEYPFGQA